LKTSSLFRKGVARLLVSLLAAGAMAACSEDEPGITDADPEAIRIDEIIVSPKSPTPGDTVMLTAVITATDADGNPVTNPGDFPSVSWTANGGAFLESNQAFVRWVAPAQSQLFGITCTATNSINTTSLTTAVFVSTPEAIAFDAGEIYLEANETDFFYISTLDIEVGAEVWHYDSGTSSVADVIPGNEEGENTALSPTLTHAAFDRETPSVKSLRPHMLYLSDLQGATVAPITTDREDPLPARRYQFRYPEFSPSGDLVAFQGLRPSFFGILPDTLDVFVHNIVTGDSLIVTDGHGVKPPATFRRNNLFPSFSPDGNWLVFVSDRTGFNTWELYGLPVSVDAVVTDSSATVRLTNTGGVIVSGEAIQLTPPAMAWNGSAASPTLAVVADDRLLRLLAMTGSGAMESIVTGIDTDNNQRVRQFFWSNDGTQLAVSTFSELYMVNLSGVATMMLTKPTGDSARDIVWSPDGAWWFYRVVRSGSAWYELFDLTGVTLSVPAVITGTSPQGELGSYARDMNMGGVFTSTNDVLLFDFGIGRPSIVRLSVGGIVP